MAKEVWSVLAALAYSILALSCSSAHYYYSYPGFRSCGKHSLLVLLFVVLFRRRVAIATIGFRDARGEICAASLLTASSLLVEILGVSRAVF